MWTMESLNLSSASSSAYISVNYCEYRPIFNISAFIKDLTFFFI